MFSATQFVGKHVNQPLNSRLGGDVGTISRKDLARTLLEKAMMRPPSRTCEPPARIPGRFRRKFVAITLSKAATSPLAIGKSGMMPAQ